MKCKICGSEASSFDSARILRKYDVDYFECPNCGFIQTEEPYWLTEAYSSAITSSDIGLVQRNVSLSLRLDYIFRRCFSFSNGGGTFLDYGGGYGLLVRLMRDRGYDFEWYDEYCDNLFAQTHERKRTHYDVITSFEMLEHLPNPIKTLETIFEMCDSAIFSTELMPESKPRMENWWYSGLDHGQHISFYTPKTMDYIANKFGKNYYRVSGLHIFSNKYHRMLFPNLFYRLCTKIPFIIPHIGIKRESFIKNDFQKLTGKELI